MERMFTYKNKTAIVTGAGSGIGLAISKELIARGAKVWLTDINEEGVKSASAELGTNAYPILLDVRNANGIKILVDQVVANFGSLDFLFNNAGIGICGEMHELGVEHFDRIIDINIKGVMNGIAAAYPIMVKQGMGCIVNTASIAGLLPAPLMVDYSMTKYAIVGLSRGLRIEAKEHGVQINVLCPAAIETPLIDSTGPNDLSYISQRNSLRDYVSKLGKPYPVDKFAKHVLDKVKSNEEIIIAPKQGRLIATLFRIIPGLVLSIVRKNYLKELQKHSD
ncbi:MAG: SDR family oxidoreductase [Saprospiraceae bacterium]|nr:SDR family oxidoreductase [Saprospiraceae bacterium]